MTIVNKRTLRIGIDCGGTNTDAVVVDLSPGAPKVILATTKTPTTPEVTLGIQTAITRILDALSDGDRDDIQAVSIGTTHFVNALIQRSADCLSKVAVIRLCGPFSRNTPPFAGFPYELRDLLEGPHFFVDGGLQIDGSEIAPVNAVEIERVCEQLRKQNIRSVAISSVYAPIDFEIKQEEQVATIIKRLCPDVLTTCSKTVANIGMLERENATILNASLLHFAQLTVHGFRVAAKELGLPCPVFVTSNDGTLLTLEQAASLPIRTFSSGPTNSMRGASFLARLADPDAAGQTALVIDIGGTTTEVGVLLASGFPRQAAARYELCGVSLNFSMPHVTSMGLGGGSLVRQDGSGKVTVGPDSVGYRITEQAMAFGGEVLTATDIAVGAGDAPGVGDPNMVKVSAEVLEAVKQRMKTMLETTLDSMKTSTANIPVYLAGGGAVLAPDTLAGVSKVHRFPHYQCANAVGAAIAQISGIIDSVENIDGRSIAEAQRDVERRAIELAVETGAARHTVNVVESEAIPIAYTAGKCRFVVKAAGEWTGMASTKRASLEESSAPPPLVRNNAVSSGRHDSSWTPAEIHAYRPSVKSGIWSLSEIDLAWVCTGSYILGCGGGGDPDHTFLAARELLRSGQSIKVIALESLSAQDLIGWGGGMGSPEVASERLMSDEYLEATQKLYQFMRVDNVKALAALEIGGSNGMINLVEGASGRLDLPIVDGDFMGRAYPTGWQTTPNVYDTSGKGKNLLPCCYASGDGSVMFMTESKTDRLIDAATRASCTEMGTLVGHANRPLTAEFCRRAMIKNTLSLSWRIGRAVMLANKEAQIGRIGEVVIDALGGTRTGRVLFAGKITSVTRKVYKGHTVGEVIIGSVLPDEDDGPRFEGSLKIPFKNENLLAEHATEGGSTILCTVPDLISVLDAGNGRALGTPDYKYGQRVVVIAICAAPQWTDTERGLEIGDLRAFGYENIPYKSVGEYVEPISVIQEYR